MTGSRRRRPYTPRAVTHEPVLSYERWREYCLRYGYAHFHGAETDAWPPAMCRAAELEAKLPEPIFAEYMIRLFRDSARIAIELTRDELAGAVRFLFGVAGEYFARIRHGSDVLPQDAVGVYEAVRFIYVDLFDRTCCRAGSDPKTDYTDTDKLDMAVSMIWDMDQIEGAVCFMKPSDPLHIASRELLRSILAECRTSTCQASALTGVAYIQRYHPGQGESIIDEFLARGGLFRRRHPRWIVRKAEAARAGEPF